MHVDIDFSIIIDRLDSSSPYNPYNNCSLVK